MAENSCKGCVHKPMCDIWYEGENGYTRDYYDGMRYMYPRLFGRDCYLSMDDLAPACGAKMDGEAGEDGRM